MNNDGQTDYPDYPEWGWQLPAFVKSAKTGNWYYLTRLEYRPSRTHMRHLHFQGWIIERGPNEAVVYARSGRLKKPCPRPSVVRVESGRLSIQEPVEELRKTVMLGKLTGVIHG